MNNLLAIYERILEVLRKISTDRQLPIQRRRTAMSDLEVISLSLAAEYMGIDSENDLFRKLPPCLGNKIDRTVYNRHNYAKSFDCLRTKILTKITAMTVIQYININIFNRNINNLKISTI